MNRLVTTVESAGSADLAGLQRFVPTYYVRCGDRIAFQLPLRAGRSYRWRWNELALPGGEDGNFVLANVGTVAAGNYSVRFDDGDGSVEWNVAIVAVVTEAHLTHFALEHHPSAADPSILAGFFVGGAGAKHLELRCDALSGGELMLASWDGQKLAAGSPLEAHLESGSYSAVATSAAGLGPATLLELNDLDAPAASASISNFSGRVTLVPGSDGVALSFTISGTTAATVLLRGIGPSLAGLFALPGALSRTQMRLRDEGGELLASNLGWEGAPMIAAAFEQAGAFALHPASLDSALVMTLPPGRYTAELRAPDGEGGIGLIEVYEIPAR